MTSETKLLILKFSFLKFFKLIIPCEKNFDIIVELVTQNFQRKENFRVKVKSEILELSIS